LFAIIYISFIFHKVVQRHIRSVVGIYNNHIIANCLQSVPVKEFWKSVNNWWRMKIWAKVKSHVFIYHPVLLLCQTL